MKHTTSNNEDVKASDLFTPATKQEIRQRKNVYSTMMIQEDIANVKKTKLPDGSWHVHEGLHIAFQNLNSLKGLNIFIMDGYFDCSLNGLKTLEGSPVLMNDGFECSKNKITSLIGAPNIVNGSFYCDENHLTTLEGAPTVVTGDFDCRGNSKQFSEDDVRAVCDVKGTVLT